VVALVATLALVALPRLSDHTTPFKASDGIPPGGPGTPPIDQLPSPIDQLPSDTASDTAPEVPQDPEASVVRVEAPDHATLLAEDNASRRAGPTGLRFAVPLDVQLTPESHGSWDAAPGGRLWRLTIESPGAHTVSIGLRRFEVARGTELRILDRTGEHVHGPWGADRSGREIYTPPVPGDAIVVELFVPHAAAFAPEVEIGSVQHDYRGFGPTLAGLLDEVREDRQGSCNVDVACDLADPWRDQVRSVGVLTVRGAWMCTGSLVATADDGPPRPYFLTAFHCGVTEENDHAVRVYWNYESPQCGDRCCGQVTESQAGSTLRARFRESDFCLLELDRRPAPEVDPFYSGWDVREEHVPQEVVTIHHPGTDEKSISHSGDPLQVTSYLTGFGPGDGTHWRVDDWEVGTTEPGSSGSGIWDENGRLVGQLHGGDASCDEPGASDWYGRLAVSWEGGGTASTRLRDWLDPHGTGTRVADGRDGLNLTPTSGPPAAEPPALARIGSVRPNPVQGKFVLRYEVDAPGEIALDVVDITGRAISLAPTTVRGAGEYLLLLDTGTDGGRSLGAGVYFVKLVRDGITVDMTRLVILP
jgi:hypothetical protein